MAARVSLDARCSRASRACRRGRRLAPASDSWTARARARARSAEGAQTSPPPPAPRRSRLSGTPSARSSTSARRGYGSGPPFSRRYTCPVVDLHNHKGAVVSRLGGEVALLSRDAVARARGRGRAGAGWRTAPRGGDGGMRRRRPSLGTVLPRPFRPPSRAHRSAALGGRLQWCAAAVGPRLWAPARARAARTARARGGRARAARGVARARRARGRRGRPTRALLAAAAAPAPRAATTARPRCAAAARARARALAEEFRLPEERAPAARARRRVRDRGRAPGRRHRGSGARLAGRRAAGRRRGILKHRPLGGQH